MRLVITLQITFTSDYHIFIDLGFQIFSAS
nr:MAG TPA: hypothetical protein [Caudoviricetes sp.]